ncbi:MAG: PilZ domain-containing protein [Bacillota bacterium]
MRVAGRKSPTYPRPMDGKDPSTPFTERRREPRTKVMLVATLERPGSAAPVRLRDLSANGSALIGAVPDRYCSVILRRDAVELKGRVAWTAQGGGGLSFDEPAHVGKLLRPVSPRRTEHVPACRRPRLYGHVLTPAEREAIRHLTANLGMAFELEES